MNPVYFNTGSFETNVTFHTQRVRDNGAPYLITMYDQGVGHCFERGAVPFAQSRAVMDDFGQLVLVRQWM